MQEALGADVNLLLFCAWMGSRGIGLSADDISVAGGAVGRWHDDVIRPLRSVRRYVKTLTRADLENFRSRVKGIELEAEQVEQALLFNIAQRFSAAAARAGRNSVADNVARYIRMRSAGAGKDHSTPHLIEAASL